MTKAIFNRRKANRDFSFKIKMERMFRRPLLRYFNKVKKAYKSGLQLPTIMPVLEEHYQRIVRGMKRDAKRNQQDEDRIKTAVAMFLLGRPQNQAVIIDPTTKDKINQARQHLIKADILNPTRSDIANVMTRLNKARISGIAETETQMTFEGLKNTVVDTVHIQMENAIVDSDEKRADELAAIGGDWASAEVAAGVGKIRAGELFGLLALATKTWWDMMDSRVRPWHRAAGGQTVARGQPYIVKGELLMYPGDTSMGASMDNIANCRCVST